VSIIDGFNSPVKPEHVQIFEQCLLPMHRHQNLNQFRQQLVKAMSKFIIKDESLTDQAILSCIKFWPKVDPHKEVGSLVELETLLNLLHTIEPLIDIRHYLLSRLAKCISSLHFCVAERALLLLHNPVLLCLIKEYKNETLPVLVDAILANLHRNEDEFMKVLQRNGTYTQKDFYEPLNGAHWSKSVRGFSIEALKLLTD